MTASKTDSQARTLVLTTSVKQVFLYLALFTRFPFDSNHSLTITTGYQTKTSQS